MSTTPDSPAPPNTPGVWPAPGLHQGLPACRALLGQALQGLAPTSAPSPWAGTRQLWLADPDFADWPLDNPAVLGAVSAWLRLGGRQLHLIGQHFDTTARCHPRLARWRRDWTHAIAVWSPTEGGLPPALRGVLAGPLWVQRLDAPDWRFRCFTEPVHAQAVQTHFADFLQRCEPAWPETTLGL